LALAAGSTLAGRNLAQARTNTGSAVSPGRGGDSMAILIDTTKCLGCRMCELACARENGLPEPEAKVDFSVTRKTSPTQLTVVNRYETSKGTVSVKRQCMHCLTPACTSACLTKALAKSEAGPVVWREDKCMGCRYCMISCPFDVPKFEYDNPNPAIRKCQMCASRLVEGQKPACVENCPAGALSFGSRREMLDEAHRRIATEPDKYVHHIYGEDEAGGTSWLYLSAVPFEEIGFPTEIGSEAYPVLTKEFLYAVPFLLTIFPPLLLAVSEATKARGRRIGDGEEDAS
ncbi:MAG: 4Fe-4S dicluster domain-containing protein, partial [Gemmatimonadota bacterium]